MLKGTAISYCVTALAGYDSAIGKLDRGDRDMSRFHFRGFVSILLSVAFLVVVTTGLVLWFSHSPQTFGIGKGVWKHAHIFVSLLLLIAGILHLWLNWSVYWGYLWDRTAHSFGRKRELALAMAITALIVGTAALDDHGGDMMRLATMSLQEIAKRDGKTAEQVVLTLKDKGIHVHDSADSLLKIAEHNDVPPQAILAILQPQRSQEGGRR
jgi:hypothetical protein